jgi:hypothetical protein
LVAEVTLGTAIAIASTTGVPPGNPFEHNDHGLRVEMPVSSPEPEVSYISAGRPANPARADRKI